jgi:hypothetical protein
MLTSVIIKRKFDTLSDLIFRSEGCDVFTHNTVEIQPLSTALGEHISAASNLATDCNEKIALCLANIQLSDEDTTSKS